MTFRDEIIQTIKDVRQADESQLKVIDQHLLDYIKNHGCEHIIEIDVNFLDSKINLKRYARHLKQELGDDVVEYYGSPNYHIEINLDKLIG